MAVNVLHKHFHHRHKKNPQKNWIDKLVIVAVVGGPAFTVPQAYEVWFQECQGVSVWSWGAYLVIAVIWLLYGLKHREKPIILSQLLWILLDSAVVLGIILKQ